MLALIAFVYEAKHYAIVSGVMGNFIDVEKSSLEFNTSSGHNVINMLTEIYFSRSVRIV